MCRCGGFVLAGFFCFRQILSVWLFERKARDKGHSEKGVNETAFITVSVGEGCGIEKREKKSKRAICVCLQRGTTNKGSKSGVDLIIICEL